MKEQIRKKLQSKRKKLTQKEVEEMSKRILLRLSRTQEFKKARTILLYHPVNNEVDTVDFITRELSNHKPQKTFCLPRICGKTNRLHIHQFEDPNTLETGRFSIKEPSTAHPVVPRSKIDLVITPGLAFDPHGNRIGYGKGYFDKLFKSLSTDCTKIALAYDFQIVENIPAERHDQKVNLILTEKRKIKP